MSCATHCCVLTRGEFFLSDWNGANCFGQIPGILCTTTPKAFKKVGNVSSCLVEIATEVIGQENKFNPVSDTCPRVQILGVTITLALSCASKDNLYRALYADVQEADSGTHIKDFCFTDLSECDFFPFEKQQAFETNLKVYLRDASGIVISELTLGTDFKFSKSGIEILRDDIVIGTAVTLRLVYDYDNANHFSFDFNTKMQGYKSLFFKGVNYDSADGAMFDAIFNKVLFAPINQFDLITRDEFLTLTLTGKVEFDGEAWFKLTKQEGVAS